MIAPDSITLWLSVSDSHFFMKGQKYVRSRRNFYARERDPQGQFFERPIRAPRRGLPAARLRFRKTVPLGLFARGVHRTRDDDVERIGMGRKHPRAVGPVDCDEYDSAHDC